MSSRLPDLCIVVPAHNEEQNLRALHAELATECATAGIIFELLFVDDGSRDNTADIIRDLAKGHDNVRALILSRNFGHQASVSIGLQYSRGRAVAVMDADLQDKPHDVVQLYQRWKQGADVVYAVRRSRQEGLLRRVAYSTFYRLFARLARMPAQVDSGDFCVMDAAFVAKLNALPERLRFVRGLRAWIGGRQEAFPVDRDPRRAGEAQYSFGKLVGLAMDGFISFSDAPLRFASFAGIVVSGAAFAGVVLVLIWKALGLLPSGAGVATIALSVLLLGGIQLLTIGILGEYIGRIFQEVKQRPVAVVSEFVQTSEQAWLTQSSSINSHPVTIRPSRT